MEYSLYYTATSLFSRLLSFILGFVVMLIVLLVSVGTFLDIAYIMIPPFQSACDKFLNGKRSGGFHIISHAAVNALDASAAYNVSPIIYYFKERLKVYIIAAILVYIIMTISDMRLAKMVWHVLKSLLVSAGLLKD